jgi:hypothetical protein
MKRPPPRLRILGASLGAWVTLTAAAARAQDSAAPAMLTLPLERTAYFVGETVPLGLTGGGTAAVSLEAVNADGRTLLYRGPAAALWLDTAALAPGDYALEADGAVVLPRLTLTSPLRRSLASLQDEATPPDPQFERDTKPEARAEIARRHWDEQARILNESGLTACFALAASDMGMASSLDTLARAGTLLLVNPDTRPTSFNPGTLMPVELDGMRQRLLLTAQANARYPNFAGFCYGWDTCGYAVGARRQLLVYWGWGDKTEALRTYIDGVDRFKTEEFTRRTGLEPVSEQDYIAYLVSTGHADLAPAIDLPTRLWLDELTQYAKPMPATERAAFEKRLDAWSAYLMEMYGEVYAAYSAALRELDPTLRHTASVQIDHAPTRMGQYFPSAYAPLDLRYQSTWNDQVGGPDYLYQWLLTQGILDMHRAGRPVWISNALAVAHHRAAWPGKFTRVAAHGLAYGSTGLGFALEGFSNILGGMNRETNWDTMKGKAGEADLRAGREFLERFAALARGANARNGVGILFSRTQYGRQSIIPAFGSAPFITFVSLARLGYTPCFLTEEEIAVGQFRGVQAVLALGQTVPLPGPVQARLAAFAAAGGRILVDGNTTVALPAAERLPYAFPLSAPGKPHNWHVPNMPAGENDTTLITRWHAELAPVLAAALEDTGRGTLAAVKGAATDVSVFELAAGADARYLIAVNDSSITTQADWSALTETLAPAAGAAGTLYDVTEEQALGALAPVECDLRETTARVYAVLARPLAAIAPAATQRLRAGEHLDLQVEFHDAKGKRLAAVLPFHVALSRPDGQPWRDFYRATDAEGRFAMQLRLPRNLPAGAWRVAVRSQLTGEVATLPVTVEPARATALARPLPSPVVWRDGAAVEALLKTAKRVVVPVFDSPQADTLTAAAEQLKSVLARRGITVEVWRSPPLGTYTLAYACTPEQAAENARIERGELIGQIKRLTVNANDWFSALGGYRFGVPVILLELPAVPAEPGQKATPPPVNPMAAALARAGMLWPRASAAFPGAGGAVVQAVQWAFAPRVPALVIQAADSAGLERGIAALAKPASEPDPLTTGIRAVRGELWAQHGIGPEPERARLRNLGNKGLATAAGAQPFRIAFPGERPPARAAQAPRPPPAITAQPIPATFTPAQYTIFYRVGERWQESATAGMLVPDLRFSEGIRLVLDVPQAGRTRVVADGIFRYSDRRPCWQAQWEDILNLRERLVPAERRPMEFAVLLDGQPAGRLAPSRVEEKEVQLYMGAGTGPKAAPEEVVTRLEGEVELPAGRHELMLVHRNIVDGKLLLVGVGMEPVPPAAPEKK